MTYGTKLALAYHEHPNSKTFEEIRQMTMSLIYRLPRVNNRLRDDECSAFLLFCAPSIDSYIDRYDATRSSFEHYLGKIIDVKIQSFYERHLKSERRRIIAETFWNTDVDAVREEEPEYNAPSPVIDKSLLPSLFSRFALPKQGKRQTSGEARRLACSLKQAFIRKGFILLLSSHPGETLTRGARDTCSLLGEDYRDFVNYFGTLENELACQRIARTETERLMCRHYTLMLYEESFRDSSDRGNMKFFRSLAREEKNRDLYKKAAEEYGRSMPSLSRSRVASLLGLATGTVNSTIYYAKKRFESIFTPVSS